MANDVQPYIPASRVLPEFTLQAILLGVILSLAMCAANIYVGLYAGMTVSAARLHSGAPASMGRRLPST